MHLPPKDLCRDLAKETDMKSAFQANFGLQAQLLLLLSSHKAWLQCQLGWGKSPAKGPSDPCVSMWHHFLPVVISSILSKNSCHRQPCMQTLGPAALLHCLPPTAPAMLPVLSYQETLLYMRSQTLYEVLSAFACVSAFCKTHRDGNTNAKCFKH